MALHENPDPCFNGFQLSSSVELRGNVNVEGFQNESKIRVVNIHESIQITWKCVYFPLVKSILNAFSAHSNIPVGVMIVFGICISYSFLNNTHHHQCHHTNQKMSINNNLDSDYSQFKSIRSIALGTLLFSLAT